MLTRSAQIALATWLVLSVVSLAAPAHGRSAPKETKIQKVALRMGMEPWSQDLIDYLVANHPSPKNKNDLYHDVQHTLDVAARAYISAIARGLSPVQAQLMAKVGILHDLDPEPGRMAPEVRGQPRVPRTLAFLDRELQPGMELYKLLKMAPWEVPICKALVHRSEFPFVGNSSDAYETETPDEIYRRMIDHLDDTIPDDVVRNFPNGRADFPEGVREFVRREGGLFAVEADIGAWGWSLKDAVTHYKGLVREKRSDKEKNAQYQNYPTGSFLRTRHEGLAPDQELRSEAQDKENDDKFAASAAAFRRKLESYTMADGTRPLAKFAWREVGIIAAFEYLERVDPNWERTWMHLVPARLAYTRAIAKARIASAWQRKQDLPRLSARSALGTMNRLRRHGSSKLTERWSSTRRPRRR